MKKTLIIFLIITLWFTSYIIGYNTATTTDNLELVMPSAEDEDYDWFDTMNDNMDLIDANNPQIKIDATTSPTVNNDTTEDYTIGSLWYDITNDKAYVCLDATDGAAVWTETTQAGGGSGTVDTSGTPVANDIPRFTDANTIEGLNYAELKTALDLEIGTDVLAEQTIGIADNNLIEIDHASVADDDYSKFTANGLEGRSYSEVRTDLGLVIGTNVQAFDDALTNISALTYVSPSFIKLTANDTYAVRTLAEVKTDLAYQLSDMSDVGSTTPTDKYVLVADGDSWESRALVEADISDLGTAAALVADKLSVFAATTSAELAGVISDETGTLKLVYSDSPVFTTQITTPKIVSVSNADITIQPNGTGDTIIYAPADVVTTVTAAHTMTIAEAGTVLVSCAATPYTITLPTASGHTGLRYHFIKTDANYYLITLDGDGAETFNYENSTSAPVATYARLNTYCAEVTIISDDTNWQVISEVIGQVPRARAYLDTTQADQKTTTWTVVALDTEVHDIGNNFDHSLWVSGSADGTVAGHLQDDTNSQFTEAMVGYKVRNTTDATEATIYTFNDAGDVTISADIFVDTENYEIYNAKFVCPVAGKYLVYAGVGYSSVIADKRYYCAAYNGATGIFTPAAHSSSTDNIYTIGVGEASCAVDDEIVLKGYNTSGVNTVDIYAVSSTTYIDVRLTSKD